MLNKPDTCRDCIGWKWGCKGYVPASGDGSNGVLVVAEAAGEHEATEGMPLVGKAGYYLWQNLLRVGIEREGFRCHNVLSCRPPDNKLSKMPYEDAVITHCTPLLDATIEDMQRMCARNGRTFVIVTLGQIAFKRILGITQKDPIFKYDYLCYPIRSERYGAWVIAADHPSYLMRGANHELPVLQFGFKRALEIAEHGLTLDDHRYLLDPDPSTFAQWVKDYFSALENDSSITLSYDIETPYKQNKGEDELSKDEDGDDYRILRVSFSYRPNEAVSVPWSAEYLPNIEALFASKGTKLGWNSANYDDPRILQHMPIEGDKMDGMLMWHVLNSALDKRLGYVTPFYCGTTGMWKHMSAASPAFYNAKDSDMALRCYNGIKRDLVKNGQWETFDRHVVQLNRALHYMSGKGVLQDQVMRQEAEGKMQDLLDVTEIKMEATVPKEAKKFKVFKKTPKNIEGLELVEGKARISICPSCYSWEVKADHFKSVGKKRLKAGIPENSCYGYKAVKEERVVQLYAKVLPFKLSKQSLSNYQCILRHQAILSRKERKVTFDENAILKLVKQYPNDRLYPLILEHREVQKLLSTYIGVTGSNGIIKGGMPVGEDGRIHTMFTHNPSTLRLASQNPNLQNLPRPRKESDLATIIRNLIVAAEGHIFTARDYSGIEAVLVGYFACSPSYIRLAKMDVHSFYTAYALHELDGRVRASDLPQLSWSDDKLREHLAGIKREFKHERNTLFKHLVHGANFYQGPMGAKEKILKETGIDHKVGIVSKVMAVYFELFPDIKKWHHTLWHQAEKEGFVRNPFGYVHRFYKVFDYEKIGGKWEKKPGADANKVVAFLPQSTAAGIIKEAILRLYFDRFDEAGQWLRLQVHDEVFAECPLSLMERVDAIMKEEMERPIKALPLPSRYGMGPYLIIDTEAKSGARWGSMH